MERSKETCCLRTPAQTQKTLADEPGPNLSRNCHVGLPGLRENPAERCQKEEVQKGCRHDADTLVVREMKSERYVVHSLMIMCHIYLNTISQETVNKDTQCRYRTSQKLHGKWKVHQTHVKRGTLQIYLDYILDYYFLQQPFTETKHQYELQQQRWQ